MRNRTRGGGWLLCTMLLVASGCSSSNSSKTEDPDKPDSELPGPGDFSSVWRATSAEVIQIDNENPTAVSPTNVTLPVQIDESLLGRKVEILRQFDGNTLITYAFYEGDDSYYRIRAEASLHGSTYVVQLPTGDFQYTLDDGDLLEVSQLEIDDRYVVISTTKLRPVSFPPSGWPAKVIDTTISGAQ